MVREAEKGTPKPSTVGPLREDGDRCESMAIGRWQT
jgi:hypothetical protein